LQSDGAGRPAKRSDIQAIADAALSRAIQAWPVRGKFIIRTALPWAQSDPT
jgi:hypothetical protein